ncbi:MAG TPA: HD domain-containing phosphohydrolase [Holophagaceae bacterium]|nr:HD domain-containing phosphohydrolase [Holophagaceae bacterium]
MPPSNLLFGEALATRCAQAIYRCLEEVGSTKGALYLRQPGGGPYLEVCHYGWPRGTRPPESITDQDPLQVRVAREKRSFAVNTAADALELTAFGLGERPRCLVTPIYMMGDQIGVLVQRDPAKGDAFDLERAEAPTLRICHEIVDLVKEFGVYGPAKPKEAKPLPTAAELIDQTPPPTEHAPKWVPTTEALPGMPEVIHTPSLKVGPQGQAAGEKLFGYENTQVGFSALPWEAADRTLSGIMAPSRPTPVQHRKRGMMSPELRAFFWEMASLISQIVPVAAVVLWMEDPEEIRPLLCFSPLPISENLQQQVMAHATYHLTTVREQDLRVVAKAEIPEGTLLDGAFATYLPLLMNESSSGHDLLMVFRQEDQPFSMPEMEIIQRMGRVLGMQLEEARLHERYHQAFLSVSHRILKSSESRLPDLRSHSVATARLAREVALKLDLPSEDVEAVSIAAILHDVGMLLLDPALVQKAQLTPDEKLKLRQHPDLAAIFLKDLRFPFDVVRVIRHHHERWDGHGYPDKLRESAIPMGSRIIHVIEAYEVMTSGKSYRTPIGFRNALDELKKESGSQFDPTVVEAFCELMTRREGRI